MKTFWIRRTVIIRRYKYTCSNIVNTGFGMYVIILIFTRAGEILRTAVEPFATTIWRRLFTRAVVRQNARDMQPVGAAGRTTACAAVGPGRSGGWTGETKRNNGQDDRRPIRGRRLLLLLRLPPLRLLLLLLVRREEIAAVGLFFFFFRATRSRRRPGHLPTAGAGIPRYYNRHQSSWCVRQIRELFEKRTLATLCLKIRRNFRVIESSLYGVAIGTS